MIAHNRQKNKGKIRFFLKKDRFFWEKTLFLRSKALFRLVFLLIKYYNYSRKKTKNRIVK